MKRFTWVLLTALLSAIHAQAEVPLSSIKRVATLPTVSNKFIVELDSLSDIPSKRDVSPHANLYESLKKRDVGFEVNKEFNSAGLFVGAALTLTDAKDVDALLNTPGVKAIRPIKKLARPAPVKKVVVKDRSDPAVPADTQSTHVLTGVDKLHAQGIIGTGVKIGIIDTGIDYNHPALGAGFGPGHKVIGGYDLVGDDYTGDNTPVPDPDPLDQCEGHGTHVAGIIGANPGNPFDISGVAYGASISAYRVFGCAGQVTDDVIVEALLLGVKEGQDILTLSLGGTDGWTESSSSVVASRIAASGKIVTIAAGNDGDSGSWYTSSPGNGIDVISVASLDNTVIALQNATVGGVQHPPITYFSALPLPITSTLPVYATSNSTTVVDDACNPLPDSTPDLSSKLVLIRRGSCTFVQKLTNAAAKGAKYALIYDNGSGFAGITVGDFVATLIQAADGEFLVSQLAAGVPITIYFPQSGASTQYPDPNGGLISSFTSYGPSNDFYFKPSVAAPGGNILSTLPLPLGAYGVESGTSMATPFVAGSAALVLSVKGKTPSVAKSIRSLFESTAKQVPSSKTDGDPLQTLTQQGAGLINVYDAIQATTVISPTQLILNDTAHFHPLQTFTIKNTGKTVKTYRLSHVPAGTAQTVKPDSILPALGPVPLTTAAVSVTIFPKTVTVRPGSSQTVTAVFQLPSGDTSTFPVYSGFIQASGSSASDSFHVSYLGLGAALKNKQVVDNSDFYFGIPTPAVLDSIGNIQSDPTNYTFVGGDWPSLVFRLAFGTPTLRVDLVDPNIKLVGTLNTRQERQGGPIFTFPKKHPGGSFAQVKILGSLNELNWISRNDESVPPGNGYNLFTLNTPTYANGTTISNGSYRFLLRALKVTGNPDSEADYESWLSPVVGVTPV